METKIDWKNVWDKFDIWFYKDEETNWKAQQKKIQQLVAAQVRELVKWRFLNQGKKT